MRNEKLESLIKRFEKKDRTSLAQILSLIEEEPLANYRALERLFQKARGMKKIGVTGPPGAGKSSLISRMISRFRSEGKTVACVLVDPSSPISGGAVLGDRIRMQEHFLDSGVFLRSVASRGEPGGLSRSAIEMSFLLDAFGMDEIIIETLGVGQNELEVASIAETVLVVLTPEAGDAVQALKAGLLEVGDIFVVNKSDRPSAQALYYELGSMLEDDTRKRFKKVLLVSASNNQGIEQLVSAISEHRKSIEKNPDELKKLLRERYFLELAIDKWRAVLKENLEKNYPVLLNAVRAGELTSHQAIEQMEDILRKLTPQKLNFHPKRNKK